MSESFHEKVGDFYKKGMAPYGKAKRYIGDVARAEHTIDDLMQTEMEDDRDI